MKGAGLELERELLSLFIETQLTIYGRENILEIKALTMQQVCVRCSSKVNNFSECVSFL